MALQSRLDAIGRPFASRAPPHIIAAMKKATADLIATVQAGHALKVSDLAPEFHLSGPDGKDLSSRDLLAHGPLVITFYRGV